MKKLIIYFSIAAIALGYSSCSKKIDEAFPNPNANVKQPIELLLPNLIQNMAISGSSQGSNYGPQNDGLYVGRYIQFWATNSAANQYDLMGQTTTNNTSATSDIGGSHWAMHYYGMGQNITRIIEWGTEEKKWDYVGVAHALRAFGWLTTTDMHGEIIVKDAFNTDKLVFNYDDQQTVYEEVKRNCHLALDYLSRTGDGVSEANLAKGAEYFSLKGDVNKWKKFVYAILARTFHRTTNKASYQADSVVKYCDLSLQSNADNAYVLFLGSAVTATNSFFGPFRGNIGTLRQTKFVADLMSGANSAFPGVSDPRAWYILRENFNGTHKGIRPGKGYETSVLPAADQPINFWGGNTATPTTSTYTSTAGSNAHARYVWRDAMPWPVITASEIQFMKAEALYIKGDKSGALAAYIQGISLNFDMLTTEYNANVPAIRQITPAMKAAYLANPTVVPTAANLTLSHIMLQKYISMYGYGILETWVDMRRYHYIDPETATGLQVYRDFVPPATADLYINNNGKLVYRNRPRFNSEFLYNIDALQKIGALALDYHTKEQWFSQP